MLFLTVLINYYYFCFPCCRISFPQEVFVAVANCYLFCSCNTFWGDLFGNMGCSTDVTECATGLVGKVDWVYDVRLLYFSFTTDFPFYKYTDLLILGYALAEFSHGNLPMQFISWLYNCLLFSLRWLIYMGRDIFWKHGKIRLGIISYQL